MKRIKSNGKVHVRISVKRLDGRYHIHSRHFKGADGLDNYLKDLMVRGIKVIGIVPMAMNEYHWQWKEFFDQDPEYVAETTWKRAIKVADRRYGREHNGFHLAISTKKFAKAKMYYYEHLNK